jgi:hypothetical protein
MIVSFWPEANRLLAIHMSSRKIMVYDFAMQRWSEFTHTPFGFGTASPDGKYLYTDAVPDASGGAQILRLRLADKKLEIVLSLKGIRRVDARSGWRFQSFDLRRCDVRWVTAADARCRLTGNLCTECEVALKRR